MKIDGFDWDSGNSMKSEEKHGISRESIELFFHGRPLVGPDLKHSYTEDRFLALGKDKHGKHMIVAFTFRTVENGNKLIRPISARYMHQKEVLKYEQAFTTNENR
jgi:uncharacterized DUF497 family protein